MFCDAKADWNESHFNQLLVEASAEIDIRKRTEMYGEMQRLVSDKGGTIIPFFRNWIYARRFPFAQHGAAMSWLRKGFGFSGGWTVNDQNDLLAPLFGLRRINKI